MRSTIDNADENESSDNGSSSDDEIFSSFNMTLHKKSFEKDVYDSHFVNSSLSIGNRTQPNLTNKVHTTDSFTKNGLFFQNETHLVQWLETRKDLVLQALNTICSLPAVTLSQQVS